MTAKNKCRDALYRDVKFFCQEIAEARGVQNTRHANNLIRRQAREFLQRPNHRIKRVGYADHQRVWRIFLDAFADRFHHLQVNADKVIAAHPRLTGNAGSDDTYISAFDVFVILRPLKATVIAINRGAFSDIQGFAFRQPFRDVEQNNIA